MLPHYTSALCAVRPLGCHVPPPISCHAGLPCPFQNLALPRTWCKQDPPVSHYSLDSQAWEEDLKGKQMALISLSWVGGCHLCPMEVQLLFPHPCSWGAPPLRAASCTHECLLPRMCYRVDLRLGVSGSYLWPLGPLFSPLLIECGSSWSSSLDTTKTIHLVLVPLSHDTRP